MKEFFTKIKPQVVWKVLLAFCLSFCLLFLVDFFTKHFLFDKKNLYINNNDSYKDHVVIGIRSVPHANTTLFSALNIKLPLWATYIINFTMIIAILMITLYTKSVMIGIALGVMMAGILGNTFDILTTNNPLRFGSTIVTRYVKDIFFLPWLDRGTFNAADVFIIGGAGLVLVANIVGFFKKDSKVKKEKMEKDATTSNKLKISTKQKAKD